VRAQFNDEAEDGADEDDGDEDEMGARRFPNYRMCKAAVRIKTHARARTPSHARTHADDAVGVDRHLLYAEGGGDSIEKYAAKVSSGMQCRCSAVYVCVFVCLGARARVCSVLCYAEHNRLRGAYCAPQPAQHSRCAVLRCKQHGEHRESHGPCVP
jgi:hypothetical protein